MEEEERAGRAPAGKDLLAAAVQRAQQRDASSDEEDALSEDEPEDAYIDDFQITTNEPWNKAFPNIVKAVFDLDMAITSEINAQVVPEKAQIIASRADVQHIVCT